jgi:hypothetical protein
MKDEPPRHKDREVTMLKSERKWVFGRASSRTSRKLLFSPRRLEDAKEKQFDFVALCAVVTLW